MQLNKNIVTSHIHLLSPNAFKSREPNHLMAEYMNKATEDINIKDAADYFNQQFKKTKVGKTLIAEISRSNSNRD